MRVDEITENIPEKYYPLLNEYILRGKRMLLQQDSLMEPLRKRKLELHDKICELITEVETSHFKFMKFGSTTMRNGKKETHWDWIRLFFLTDPNDRKNLARSGYNWIIETGGAATLDGMFFLVREWISEHKKKIAELYPYEFTQELPELISKVKKKIALTFFEYRMTYDKYYHYKDLWGKRMNDQRDIYVKIKDMWNEDYPCKVGTEIQYCDKGKSITEMNRTGTVVQIGVGSSDDYIQIKSDKGKYIWRRPWEVTWENRFSETTLAARMTALEYYLPKCWSEKRLDYYV